ncbi:MAG: hypothetical protein RR569_10825 [Acinetobacter sp.]
MKAFFLNLTRILESNSKIYWSVIVAIAGCLILYIAEIVHIQNLFSQIHSQDASVVRAVIDPIAQRYQWARFAVFGIAVLWSVLEYFKAKKHLNLQ